MGLPSYVLNWDEFARGLLDMADVEANVSIEPLAELLSEYLSRIQQALAGVAGSQRIKGFALPPSIDSIKSVVFTPEEPIALTGVTFSQNLFTGTEGFDKWSLGVGFTDEAGESVSALILDGVYAKDGLQHKYFEHAFVCPAGAEIRITIESTNPETAHWFDLEYLTDLRLPPANGGNA